MTTACRSVWKSHSPLRFKVSPTSLPSEYLTQSFLLPQEILKTFDTYKALVGSVNLSSRELAQTGSAESRELQDRVGQLRLHWDTVQGAVDSWREGLRRSLMQCQVRRPQPAPQAQALPSPRGWEKQILFSSLGCLCVAKYGLC